MLTYFVNFLTGLLRWIIITYLFKPVVDWVIINPLSEVLQGGSPVNVIEGSIEGAIESVFEDAIDASVGIVDSASVVLNGTI